MTSEKSQSFFVAVLFVILGVLSFFIVQSYLTAIILAVVFAVIFWPLYRWILSAIHLPSLAALCMVVVVLVVFLLPLSLLGTLALNEAFHAYQSLAAGNGASQVEGVLQLIQNSAGKILPSLRIEPLTVNQYAKSILEWLIGNLGVVFAGVAQGLLTFVLSLLSLFYFFRDGSAARQFLINHSPLHEPYNTKLIEKIKTEVNSVVRGSLVIALLQGIVCGIGFLVFGVPNPALWGGLAMISALVPTFGTSLVLIPAALYLIFVGKFAMALGLLIWGFAAVGLFDHMLGPKLMSRGTHMHPLVTFFGVIGGISFFGPIGFVLGPIIFALLSAVSGIYFELVKKQAEQS